MRSPWSAAVPAALVIASFVGPMPARVEAAAAPGAPAVAGALQVVTLRNGLRLVLAPDSLAPTVDVAVWYDSGLRHERAGRAGIAHLLEHLMQGGSAHVPPGEHARRIEALGGTSGAVTGPDATEFFDTVPASGLAEALTLEADRMTGLVIDQGRLDATRLAVRAERQQGDQRSPLVVAHRAMAATAFGGHPYRSAVLGDDAELQALTLETVRNWYRDRYGPRRAFVTIVGRFDANEALRLARAAFEPLKGGADPPAAVPIPARAGERRADQPTPYGFSMLAAGWVIPGRGDPDLAPLQVASVLLEQMDDARIQRTLLVPRSLGQLLDSDVDARRDASLFSLVAGARGDADTSAVEAALSEGIATLASGSLAADALEPAKRRIVTGVLFGWQSSRGRAQAIGGGMAATGDPNEATRQIERIKSVTSADLARAVQRYLDPGQRAVVWLTPAGSSAAGVRGSR